MNRAAVTTAFILITLFSSVLSQIPTRIQVPGAISLGATRPGPRKFQSSGPREVRPVVEDIEEPNYPSPRPLTTSFLDDEVNKLGLALQEVREEQEDRFPSVPFRPERPVPVLREQIRDKPRPTPTQRPIPILRQETREDFAPVRSQTPVRQQVNRPAPVQNFRAAPVKITPRQQLTEEEEDELRERRRKPVSQILRKYRTDNEDGSITWGFENDDGTYKEETLGADCIIRGKYGYVDPDGVKREFSYETGNKCDEPDPEDEDIPQRPNVPQSKNRPAPYRPAAQPQYVN
ncbi:hypothetical protein ABEB36_004694 [Hypothenemus hampei]|uniref:Uncharacterized protein n=1 Tax=Hypothenemus hampei TaxID=57062 RepID=A0ABD1F457_HYPHA